MRHFLKFIAACFIVAHASAPNADTQRGIRNYKAIIAGQKKFNQLDQEEAKEVLAVYKSLSGDGCSSVIESYIDGTFEGWSGETVFKLTNNQIWQQSSYAYTYHYAYRPSVIIYSGSGGCSMKVDGVSESIHVKRLK